MHTVETRDGNIPTLTLTDSDARSSAVLAPARGGMLIGLELGGRQVLYLDRATFEDPKANVRGGVPVLFPSPGKLHGDHWSRGEDGGTLKQHGFARNLPWVVTATGTDDGAWATLTLASSEATLASYPWPFVVAFTYRLRGRAVAIEMRFENTGTRTMPFGAGFHPYFAIPQSNKPRTQISTHATSAFDNVAKREVPFTGFDLTRDEVDLHLLDHGSSESTLTEGDLEVHLRGSAELTHWVVWTLKDKDFVCLEPWTCPGDALNTGDRLLMLQPGQTRTMRLLIERT